MNTVMDLPKELQVDLKTKTVMVIDNGIFVEFAKTLSKHFKKVYYFMNWVNAFPKSNPYIVGEGVEGIERVNYMWDYFDEVDLFVFPDVYYGDLQLHLQSLGKLVWGARKGEEMELYRDNMKEYMKSVGEYVTPYKVITGLDNLREYLKNNENVWVKQNVTRGDFESFHSINYENIEPLLDELEHNLGAVKYIKEFIVEDAYDNAVETGVDMYTVDGKYPNKTLAGIEVKDCYDDQTEVLTDEGWKLFKNLNRSEKIFTLRINDGTGYIKSEFQKPTDYIERDYNGELVSIEKDTVSLRITPTHNLLVRDGIQNENAEYVSWATLEKGRVYGKESTFKRGKQVLRLQKAIDVINRNKRFSLFQPRPTLITDFDEGRLKNSYFTIGGKKIRKIWMAQFMGLYLSEGSVKKIVGKKGDSYYINISQFKYVNEFCEMLKKMPFTFTKVKSGFNCYDSALGKYLYDFGKAKDKFIPDWIKKSGKNIINSFLDAYCLGDGSFSYNYKKIRKDSTIYNENYTRRRMISRYFYTSSKRMADDLQELLVKIGGVSLSRIDKEYYNNKENRLCNMYGVQEKLINRKNYIFPKDVNYLQYSGKVYCVTVPNGIIMIRRNGKSMWCGNCGYIGKIVKYDSLSPKITGYNDKISEAFNKYGYKGFFSTEIRISKDKPPYMLDKCSRAGSPPSELYQLMYKNLAEIVWYGASGFLIDPITECKFGVEALIHSSWADKNWQAVSFPKKYRDNIKLRNACVIEGKYYCVPQTYGIAEIGAIVAEDNTLEGAIEKVMEISEQVKGYYIDIKTESFNQAKEEFEKLEKMGIKIL